MTTTPKERTFWTRWAGLTLGVVALLFLGLVTPAVAAGRVHRVTLTMKEFRYEPAILHLRVGEQVVLTIKNEGQVEHEWVAGRGLANGPAERGYHTDLFAILKPKVTGRDYELEKVSTSGARRNEAAEGEAAKVLDTEVDVEAGGVATLRFTVPATAKGQWEMGCFLPGHYESGMKGTIVIE